jgi:hypothetical protein
MCEGWAAVAVHPSHFGADESVAGISARRRRYPDDMTGALLARLVFAIAAASAAAASVGLAVPAHVEQPGTPPFHEHVLAAYRFGFLIEPMRSSTLPPAMENLHRTLVAAGVPPEIVAQMPGMGLHQSVPTTRPVISAASFSPIQDLAIVLALLTVVVPRLARPTRHAIAEWVVPRLSLGQWQFSPALAPPRGSFFSHAAA